MITKTAVVHAAAWKEMFDDYLRTRTDLSSDQTRPFDPRADYDRFVDGKPRYDGVRSFLTSRSIELPDGDPADEPTKETVCGLGNRKNELVSELIARDGVEPYEGSVNYLEAAKAADMRIAVVSSSANCRAILESCGLLDYFEEVMDGVVAAERGIPGKPAPDTFIAAAKDLGAGVNDSVVYEDALAGVQAGRDGAFAYVVGVDRVGQRAQLLQHGASIVVEDLSELLS